MPTFEFEGRSIQAEGGETVLGALLRHGEKVGHGCKAGACQSCLLRSQNPPASAQNGLDEVLVERGAFLSCLAKAETVSAAERLGSEALPRYRAQVISTRKLADDVLLLELEAEGWEASPGRFVRLIHPSGVARPYSLAAPAWGKPNVIQFHVRLLQDGAMSLLLGNVVPGDPFEVEGPFGKCRYRSETKQEPIVMIGSGTGLAPLYGIATDALRQGHRGPIRFYHGAASGSRLYFRKELRDLQAAYPNFVYRPFVDADPSEGDSVGTPLAGALADHPNLEGCRIYTCGHPDLVRMAQRKCFLAGASLKDIAADAFAPST